MTVSMTVGEALGGLAKPPSTVTGWDVLRALAERWKVHWADPELERLVVVHKDRLRHKVSVAEIESERHRGWTRFHPEEFCHCCGYRFEPWTIGNEEWNGAMRQEDGTELYDGIVCLPCFQELNQSESWLMGYNTTRDVHGHLQVEASYL